MNFLYLIIIYIILCISILFDNSYLFIICVALIIYLTSRNYINFELLKHYFNYKFSKNNIENFYDIDFNYTGFNLV